MMAPRGLTPSYLLSIFTLLFWWSFCVHVTRGGQAPYNLRDVAISSNDRVYLADQTSSSISVVDPATEKLLGMIRLGTAAPDSLRATYRQQLLVHGMGYSPDASLIAAVCVASNAVVFIDTKTNEVKKIVYVGRAPHEAMWTPDGKEVWVAVRGQDYIQVVDGATFELKDQIKVPDGPGMTIFSPDGKYAYICSSFTPLTVVIDTATRQTVGQITQKSPFCPNIAAAPDGSQVWFTLKDTGRTQVFSGQSPFQELAIIETGPITNHVNFIVNEEGMFACVSVGGLNMIKFFDTNVSTSDGTTAPKLIASVPTGDLPHGLWPSGDGTRLYVGLENGNGLQAIDTIKKEVVGTIGIGGQSPMAMLYVPNAAGSLGREAATPAADLSAPTAAESAQHLKLKPIVATAQGEGKEEGQSTSTVVVNKQGMIDLLQVACTGLKPKEMYVLALADNADGSGPLEGIANFTAGPDGASVVSTLGPFHYLLFGDEKLGVGPTKYLIIAMYDQANDQVGQVVQVPH